MAKKEKAIKPKPMKQPTKKITPEMLGHVTAGFGSTDGMFDGQLDDPNKHLKELLNTEGDIDGKTDLTEKHIRSLIIIEQLAFALGEDITDSKGRVVDVIADPTIMKISERFKKLRISKKRESRKEFVSGIQGSNQMNRQEGMFNRLGSWLGGNR